MDGVTMYFLESLLFAYPESIKRCESRFRRLPLHIAIKARVSDEVVLYLLNKYPEAAAIQDVLGRVPLHYAISNYASMTVIKTLIKTCRSAARAPDNSGWTPLHVAANTAMSVEMVETLIESGIEAVVSKTKRAGYTPLMCAIKSQGPFRDLIIELLYEEDAKFEKTVFFQNFRDAENKAKSCPSTSITRFYGLTKLKRSGSFRLVV
jgi:ankyrin repeat protein